MGRVGDELERWLQGEEKTVASLVAVFGEKSFAVLFVVLLGVPALPLPTGGATHVFELVAALLALELVLGRDEVWLPGRWRRLELAGGRRERFVTGLMRLVRRLERVSRPRLAGLFAHRLAHVALGLLVLAGTAGAFFAPPFSGLDTLPALGVVLLSLGWLLEDVAVVALGVLVGAAGVVLELVAGAAVLHAVKGVL